MTTRALAGLACLFAALAPARAQDAAPVDSAAPAVATRRFYEVLRNGAKVGHAEVDWAPSTWNGRRTVRDTTTIVRRAVRNMGGMRDLFETTVTLELERDPDGTLWWERSRTEEAGRTTVEETTWTGQGYEDVVRVDGVEQQRVQVPLDAPVMTDAEAFVGPRLRAGAARAGDVLSLRELDVRARGARTTELTLLPAETVDGAEGPVRCTPVRQRDPASGSTLTLWLDASGAYVQLKDDQGNAYRQTTRAKAEEMPVRPAEYPICAPATPTLERIFTARRLGVDVHLQDDPDRALPRFPPSPWSHAGEPRGSAQAGWIIPVELTAYDDPAATAPVGSVDRAAFAADLAPTVLMPCDRGELVATARAIVGDAPTLREAARRLVRWVYSTLQKESPAVADATALEILHERKGDCSEHCVLFVALCRAAGIPARRCAGYTCLGSEWGAHAWAELWVGAWIGADPTTGELGSAARYLFFGYPDRPDSFPAVVSSQLGGRVRFVTRSITVPEDEGGETIDLTDAGAVRVSDKEAGRYANLLAGIEARGVPADWTVHHVGSAAMTLRGPGLFSTLSVMADQGAELDDWGGANATFSGAPAHVDDWGGRKIYLVHSRRRLVRVVVNDASASTLETLEKVLEPTFGPVGPPR
jgi:transglutaminase-like putative cysteine protease